MNAEETFYNQKTGVKYILRYDYEHQEWFLYELFQENSYTNLRERLASQGYAPTMSDALRESKTWLDTYSGEKEKDPAKKAAELLQNLFVLAQQHISWPEPTDDNDPDDPWIASLFDEVKEFLVSQARGEYPDKSTPTERLIAIRSGDGEKQETFYSHSFYFDTKTNRWSLYRNYINEVRIDSGKAEGYQDALQQRRAAMGWTE